MNKADRIDYAELLRDAYRTIERLQLDMRRLEQVRAEPVAIVGMGCRVPGAAGVEAYWDLLRNGVDAIEEVPSNRWDVAQYYDPNPGAAGKMSTRWGGFLQDVDRFDAAFFGISPREANSMDPQQRLLLEVAWEALEHAGIAPDSLMGSQTGVFVGISTGDYLQLQTRHPDPSVYDTYLATGNSHSVASGRLAYALGLHGPTLSVDTACSSSLIALHLASRAIRDGSCPIALACGVNLIVAPETTATLSKAQMMSPTGRCRTFSADADGFVRSEGCGVVVLKRLSDAQSAGDRVLAVIRGSAINQDGRSNGLTAPNGLAQTAVIRAALADAGLEAADVSYVEAHGTGTPLGDPIEVQALADALCAQRPASAA
jgi:acyl transferase domain-containing protein